VLSIPAGLHVYRTVHRKHLCDAAGVEYFFATRVLLPSYEDLVPGNYPVRVVNEVMERIDIGALERRYKGGGTSSYHPRMLLKVLLYAYLRNIYSSRKMEQVCGENVHFMWLAGGARPDQSSCEASKK